MPINYPDLVAQSRAVASSNLAGELPQDFLDQQAQLAAERGVASGQGASSPNIGAALLRAYGLTSLNLRKQGQEEAATIRQGDLQAAELAQQAAQFAANLSFQERQAARQMGLSEKQFALEKARLAQSGRLAEQELGQNALQFGLTNALNTRQLGAQERDSAARNRLAEQQMAQGAQQFQQTYGLNQQQINNQASQAERALLASKVGAAPYWTQQGSAILGNLGFGGAGAYPQNSIQRFNMSGQPDFPW